MPFQMPASTIKLAVSTQPTAWYSDEASTRPKYLIHAFNKAGKTSGSGSQKVSVDVFNYIWTGNTFQGVFSMDMVKHWI
ncbi:hypothetical protein ACET3Z_008603 [Daucus carota]